MKNNKTIFSYIMLASCFVSGCTNHQQSSDAFHFSRINLTGQSAQILVANNNSKLTRYGFEQKGSVATSTPADVFMLAHKKDGTSYRQELVHGNSYLSASSKKLIFADRLVSVTIFDNKGKKRDITFVQNSNNHV